MDEQSKRDLFLKRAQACVNGRAAYELRKRAQAQGETAASRAAMRLAGLATALLVFLLAWTVPVGGSNTLSSSGLLRRLRATQKSLPSKRPAALEISEPPAVALREDASDCSLGFGGPACSACTPDRYSDECQDQCHKQYNRSQFPDRLAQTHLDCRTSTGIVGDSAHVIGKTPGH